MPSQKFTRRDKICYSMNINVSGASWDDGIPQTLAIASVNHLLNIQWIAYLIEVSFNKPLNFPSWWLWWHALPAQLAQLVELVTQTSGFQVLKNYSRLVRRKLNVWLKGCVWLLLMLLIVGKAQLHGPENPKNEQSEKDLTWSVFRFCYFTKKFTFDRLIFIKR